MKLGYARVRTSEQVFELQLDALQVAGCQQAHKPSWGQLLAYARSGDTPVIWWLDRLGRATKHLIEVVENLSRRGLHLVSLQNPIDTTSPGGQLVFRIFGALAEHKRNVLLLGPGPALRYQSLPPARNSMKPASSPPASSWPIFRLTHATPATKPCALPAARLAPLPPGLRHCPVPERAFV